MLQARRVHHLACPIAECRGHERHASDCVSTCQLMWLQAFEQGGGGKKAEAMRVLAEAKAKAKAAAKAGKGQPPTEDSSASREGPDPR